MSDRYFGLDLAGFSTGRSGLAEIRRAEGGLHAVVWRNSPFSRVVKGKELLGGGLAEEAKALELLTTGGQLVAIDVPIDIDELLHPAGPLFVWQLTLRPVDFALGGCPPLADRIGSFVARFRALLGVAQIERSRLRETYPAASLRRCHLPYEKYKNSSVSWAPDEGAWVGRGRGRNLAGIADGLCLRPRDPSGPMKLSDDEVDAILCALTVAVSDRSQLVLSGENLTGEVGEAIRGKLRRSDRGLIAEFWAPENFVLLRELPGVDIHVEIKQWNPEEVRNCNR